MTAASTAHAPLDAAATDVVDAEQLAQLEAAFGMPAVEPRIAPIATSRRRAVVVARATHSGVEPAELFAALLFGLLVVGAVTLVAITLLAGR